MGVFYYPVTVMGKRIDDALNDVFGDTVAKRRGLIILDLAGNPLTTPQLLRVQESVDQGASVCILNTTSPVPRSGYHGQLPLHLEPDGPDPLQQLVALSPESTANLRDAGLEEDGGFDNWLSDQVDLTLGTLIEQAGASEEGHVRIPGGHHINRFFVADRLLARSDMRGYVGFHLARKLHEEEVQADFLVGWATTGYELANEVIDKLSLFGGSSDPPSVFQIRPSRSDKYRPELPPKEAEWVKGKRVAVFVDVLSTGDTAIQILREVQKAKAIPVAMVSLIKFECTELTTNIAFMFKAGAQAFYLHNCKEKVYSKEKCPECESKDEPVPVHSSAGWQAQDIDDSTRAGRSPDDKRIAPVKRAKWVEFAEVCVRASAFGDVERELKGSCGHCHHSLFVDFSKLTVRRDVWAAAFQLKEAVSLLSDNNTTPIDYVITTPARAAVEAGRQLSNELGNLTSFVLKLESDGGAILEGTKSGSLPAAAKSVLVVNDCVVDGQSTMAMVEFIKSHAGAKCAGVLALAYSAGGNRHKALRTFLKGSRINLRYMWEYNSLWWSPSKCPICAFSARLRELQPPRVHGLSTEFRDYVKIVTEPGYPIVCDYLERREDWEVGPRHDQIDQEDLVRQILSFEPPVNGGFWVEERQLDHLVLMVDLISRLGHGSVEKVINGLMDSRTCQTSKLYPYALVAALSTMSRRQIRSYGNSRNGLDNLQQLFDKLCRINQSSDEPVRVALFCALWDVGVRRAHSFVQTLNGLTRPSHYGKVMARVAASTISTAISDFESDIRRELTGISPDSYSYYLRTGLSDLTALRRASVTQKAAGVYVSVVCRNGQTEAPRCLAQEDVNRLRSEIASGSSEFDIGIFFPANSVVIKNSGNPGRRARNISLLAASLLLKSPLRTSDLTRSFEACDRKPELVGRTLLYAKTLPIAQYISAPERGRIEFRQGLNGIIVDDDQFSTLGPLADRLQLSSLEKSLDLVHYS